MNHILETVLFIIVFCLIVYLFILITGFYGLLSGLYSVVQEDISASELKMYDKINERITLVKDKTQKKE